MIALAPAAASPPTCGVFIMTWTYDRQIWSRKQPAPDLNALRQQARPQTTLVAPNRASFLKSET